MENHLLILVLLMPLLGAGMAELSAKIPRLRSGLPGPALVAFGLLVYLRPGATFSQPWVEPIGLSFSLHLHGIGWMLGLLVSGIGTLIVLYTNGYMAKYSTAPRLQSLIYLFMFSMLGVSLVDHLLLLFIFWELTGITSYLLIGFNHESDVARRNALQALLVTGLGGMALLAAFILMAEAAGTWRVSELTGLQGHAHYTAILILTLLGAFTKSAQFPFHFWLPNAMAAPTPVSAYLHSATMVKAGVFLLALLQPVLGGTFSWTVALTVSGGMTVLLGSLFGIRQQDFKAVLAGTTLAALGLITFLIGLGTEKALLAALAFFLAHALYKAPLFMVAGAVDQSCGTRDLRRLGLLRKAMPWTAGVAMLAALSKMGFPPQLGFISKEYAYKAGLASGQTIWITGFLVLSSALMVALAIKAGFQPFLLPALSPAENKAPVKTPETMRWAMLVPAAVGLVLGVFPSSTSAFLTPALSVAVGRPVVAELKLWTGFNLPLMLSAASMVLGVALFVLLHRRTRQGELAGMLADRNYDVVFNAVMKLAAWQTQVLQSGKLRRYLLTILVGVISLVGLKLSRFGGIPALDWSGLTVLGTMIAGLMFSAMYMAVRSNTRLSALVALGILGFCIALIYGLYSAPDLAITQILVETLTVVFFAWVVHKLPRIKFYSDQAMLKRDAAVSITAGLLLTFLIIRSQAITSPSEIAEGLSTMSLPKAYGSNVVNVILVDFRALDTWGEITVLAIAALGVAALLHQRNEGEEP